VRRGFNAPLIDGVASHDRLLDRIGRWVMLGWIKRLRKAQPVTEGLGEPKGRLRVLLVDGSAKNLDRIEQTLQDWGLQFEFERAQGRKVLLGALDDPEWDLAIVGFIRPSLGGRELLEALRTRRPDLPVIVVAYTSDRHTAMACIRAGAVDYVLRDDLARLPVSALSAIGKARAQARLMESERMHRLLVEHLPVVALSLALEPSLRITLVNKAVERVFGFPRSRWTQEPGFFPNHIHPEDRRTVLERLSKVDRNEGLSGLTFRILGAEDRTCRVSLLTTPVASDPNVGPVLHGVLQEVAEPKEGELDNAHAELAAQLSQPKKRPLAI
jgi:CheY-like chemotaxis protein